jgi:nickel-dependent lactate racemase
MPSSGTWTIEVPSGSEKLPVRLPADWLGEVVSPAQDVNPRPVAGILRRALDEPIGAPRLEDLAKPGQKVALLVDDHTRKTPVRAILPLVLEQLEAARVKRTDISIVVALGSHRLMTPSELRAKLGESAARELRIINSPSAEMETAYVGDFHGVPARANRVAVEADLRIGLGMITPHMDAGFSGGAKIVLPGVFDRRMVDAFHTRSVDLPGNPLGSLDAPLRLELERFVADHLPLDFIVNVIPTASGDVYDCVAGHSVEAHRSGALRARQVYGVSVKKPYPVVLAACHPYEQDLWQSMKGLWCGELLTADGGDLILLTRAGEGSGGYPGLPAYIGKDPDEMKQALLSGECADRMEAVTGILVGLMKRRIRIGLVSPGLKADDARSMGFAYYETVEDAIQDAVSKLPAGERRGSVAVVTHAGLVLPLLAETAY